MRLIDRIHAFLLTKEATHEMNLMLSKSNTDLQFIAMEYRMEIKNLEIALKVERDRSAELSIEVEGLNDALALEDEDEIEPVKPSSFNKADLLIEIDELYKGDDNDQ